MVASAQSVRNFDYDGFKHGWDYFSWDTVPGGGRIEMQFQATWTGSDMWYYIFKRPDWFRRANGKTTMWVLTPKPRNDWDVTGFRVQEGRSAWSNTLRLACPRDVIRGDDAASSCRRV